MQLFRNRRDNPNALVAVVLLLMLVIFAGPSNLPNLVARLPGFDEGMACERLREAKNRAYHQSLLGRAVNQNPIPPISLSVRTSPVTPEATTFSVTVVVVNETVAPVPLVITPGQFSLPTQSANGLGITFNPDEVVQQIGGNAIAYPESSIRILGPRQRCVHRVVYDLVPRPQILIGLTPEWRIKAFYRNSSTGSIDFSAIPFNYAPPVRYTDQGLWVGVVQSGVEAVGTDN